MKFKNIYAAMAMFCMGAVLLLGYTNCSDANSATTSAATTNATTAGSLTATYYPNPLYVGSTTTLCATGGTAPYTYTLIGGSGTVSGSCYTPSVEGYATVQITDSTGLVQYISIYAFTTSSSGTSTVTTLTNTIYRFNGDGKHFFSLNATEGYAAGMTLDGAVFKTLTYAGSGTILLYRCYINSIHSHFVTTLSTCSGHTIEGNYGYIYNYAATNSTPLYSFYTSTNFFVTTNYNEGANAGFTYGGIFGYVPL